MITLEGPHCIVDKSSKIILARGRVPPPFWQCQDFGCIICTAYVPPTHPLLQNKIIMSDSKKVQTPKSMKFWTGRYWLFYVSMIHIISKHSRSRLISYWDAPATDSSPPSQQTVRSLFRPHTCFATNTVTDEGNDNRRQRQMMTSNSFLYLAQGSTMITM